jgi:hypothetical protein
MGASVPSPGEQEECFADLIMNPAVVCFYYVYLLYELALNCAEVRCALREKHMEACTRVLQSAQSCIPLDECLQPTADYSDTDLLRQRKTLIEITMSMLCKLQKMLDIHDDQLIHGP